MASGTPSLKAYPTLSDCAPTHGAGLATSVTTHRTPRCIGVLSAATKADGHVDKATTKVCPAVPIPIASSHLTGGLIVRAEDGADRLGAPVWCPYQILVNPTTLVEINISYEEDIVSVESAGIRVDVNRTGSPF